MARSEIKVEEYQDDNGAPYYALHFRPDAIERLARALSKAGRAVNGYVIEALMIQLSERGDPAWAADLNFDSEHDTFVVYCKRKAPLTILLSRLDKKLAEPSALRRLVKAVPPAGLE